MSEPTLWPQAVKHAVWIYNHVPSPENGLMSVDLWTKTRYPIQKLHNLHVFGCPVYVLEKNLADGKSLGRWKARSNRCLYLGLSMQHSAEAALVLNPNTGRITPQWNVVFDDEFATVATDPEEMPDYSHEEWSRMFNTHTCHFRNNEEPSYAETTTNEEEAFEPPAPLFEEVAPGRPPTGTNRQPTYMDVDTLQSDVTRPVTPELSPQNQWEKSPKITPDPVISSPKPINAQRKRSVTPRKLIPMTTQKRHRPSESQVQFEPLS